jgi:hypothetical protein
MHAPRPAPATIIHRVLTGYKQHDGVEYLPGDSDWRALFLAKSAISIGVGAKENVFGIA